jgi:predicted esterase
MQKQNYLNITQEAKYSTLGKFDDSTEHLWFVLHGYGQLSQFFIRKFSTLSDKGHFVIAPEATSKFYLNGHDGRVGATWMTKEDRSKDIENYIRYLNSLYLSFNVPKSVKVSVIGFSQGAATASRWLANGSVQVDRLLLWSGIFPPDLDIINAQSALAKTNVYNIYGINDPYLTPQKSKEQKEIVNQLHLKVDNISFKGAHDIDKATLKLFL